MDSKEKERLEEELEELKRTTLTEDNMSRVLQRSAEIVGLLNNEE